MLDQTPLLPVLANWKSPVRELLEYKTEIVATRTGREQRRALRQTPRASLEFDIFATPLRSGPLNSFLAARPGEQVTIPHPAQMITVDHLHSYMPTWFYTAGTKPDWAGSGRQVVFGGRTGADWELVQLATSYISNVVITSTTPVLSWGPGSRIFRPVTGRLSDNAKYSADTSRLLAGKQRFDLSIGQELYSDRATLAADAGGPGELIDGRELFPFSVDWGTAVEIEADFFRESIDFGFGLREYILPQIDNPRIYQFGLTATTRLEAESIIAFFLRQLGQCRQFWLISPVQDLVPIAGLTGGSSDLKIAGMNYLRPYSENRPGSYETDNIFQNIVVRTTFGQTFRRNVLAYYGADAWEPGGQWRNTLLTVDTAWPYDVPLDTIESVSWLTKARFATDTLTIDWQHQNAARFNISVRTIRE